MNRKFKSFETHTYGEDTPEKEQEGSLEYEHPFADKIDAIFEREEGKLGEGKSASVYEDAENPNMCFKSLKLNPEKNIVKGPEPQIVNSVSKEAELLDLAHSLATDVEVPRPYGDIEASFIRENGKEGSFQAIAMERLNGVSLKDIRTGKAEFPMRFIEENGPEFLYDFFNKIEKFIQVMHDNNLYHRDMHDGNIMINLENGMPGVIDFGAGKKVPFRNSSDEEIYTEKHPSMSEDIRMVKDEHGLTQIRKQFLKFMEPKIKELTKVA